MAKRKNDEYLVDHYLHHDEEIFWMGKPNPNRLLSWGDIFLIPFSVFWCTISYAILFSTLAGFGPLGLFGLVIPHVWIGIWLFPGRFIFEHYARRNTSYVVTNHRLMIVRSFFGTSCKSTYIAQLPDLDIRARSNDTGTIRFSGKSAFSNQLNNRASARTDFYDIPDVWEVYHLIHDLYSESQLIYEEVEYYDYEEPRKRYARG